MVGLPALADIAFSIEEDGDLWAAGMDSLTSVQLLLVLEEKFQVELPDEALTFETFRSIRTLSAVLESNGASAR
ncbi:hypothetical protein IEQ44_08290 [Nocardioides sp. Y6]|uniref:Carrier domain-containing protein n=1 Tax=Nocardioides malaquae TaxID=2773426 RepID=A0ABR9RTE4_9ACTN|nr:phosphopantetheine-binding protein [Nocardioides malaquae]MBE7324650.1 hypothetical protein [Nocardioides malaquae]